MKNTGTKHNIIVCFQYICRLCDVENIYKYLIRGADAVRFESESRLHLNTVGLLWFKNNILYMEIFWY